MRKNDTRKTDTRKNDTRKNVKPVQKKFTLKISAHFSKRDFMCRCGKCDSAIRVSMGLVGGLELLRAKVQSRVTVVRGYMCADAVEAERGLRRNYYAIGLAADIRVDDMDIKDVFRFAEEIPEFKGIGLNLDQDVLHVDTRKDKTCSLWVETHGQVIPLDESNRFAYIGHAREVVTELS